MGKDIQYEIIPDVGAGSDFTDRVCLEIGEKGKLAIITPYLLGCSLLHRDGTRRQIIVVVKTDRACRC